MAAELAALADKGVRLAPLLGLLLKGSAAQAVAHPGIGQLLEDVVGLVPLGELQSLIAPPVLHPSFAAQFCRLFATACGAVWGSVAGRGAGLHQAVRLALPQWHGVVAAGRAAAQRRPRTLLYKSSGW